MNKEAIISIIIPLYNGKKYVRDCISSVSKIKHLHEIIIIDDGSTDGSFEFCKNEYYDNKNIKIFHKKNGGIASARNYGLQVASGKFVMFVDQDDQIIAETIDKAAEILLRTKNQAVFWSTYISRNGNEIAFGEVYRDFQLSKDEIIDSLIPKLIYNNKNKYISLLGSIWAGIYLKEFVAQNDIAFKSFVCYEDDFIFILDFLAKAENIYLLKEVGYIWNQNKNSRSHIYITEENILEKNIQLYEYIFQKSKELDFSKEEKEKLKNYSCQQIIENSIFYACSCHKIDFKELKKIKQLIEKREYKQAFSIDIIEPFYESRTMIFSALKHNLFLLACIEAFAFSAYYEIIFS